MVNPFTYSQNIISALERSLSSERLSTYLAAAKGDHAAALRLYFYQPKAAIADLMVMPPMRVRRISRPMAARKTCGICSAGGTRDHRVRVFSRPCRVRRMTSPSAMRCDQRKPISWK